jgi:hypothetical protein
MSKKKACAKCPFRQENFDKLSGSDLLQYTEAARLEEAVTCCSKSVTGDAAWRQKLIDVGQADHCAGYLASLHLDQKVPRNKKLKAAMWRVHTKGIVRFNEVQEKVDSYYEVTDESQDSVEDGDTSLGTEECSQAQATAPELTSHMHAFLERIKQHISTECADLIEISTQNADALLADYAARGWQDDHEEGLHLGVLCKPTTQTSRLLSMGLAQSIDVMLKHLSSDPENPEILEMLISYLVLYKIALALRGA